MRAHRREVSARCHDEEANFLALNLMHDVVTGARSVEEARAYDAKEFADHRRERPTPHMEKLHFQPGAGDAGGPTPARCRTRTSGGPRRRARPPSAVDDLARRAGHASG